MSDKNPFYDEDDPRGTVYSESTEDPYEEPDEHDPASGHYPDQKDQREQHGPHTCGDCDTEIPPVWDRCELCAREAGDTTNRPWLQDENSETDADQETPNWTFGRVVLAVVPSSTRYKALALGTSAFRLADSEALIGDQEYPDADVKPVTDFESSPAVHLTAGWGDIVDVASLESDDGERLFEAAVERTVQASGANTHLYLTEGGPINSPDELNTFREQIASEDDRYWIVPGIVRRYKSSPDQEIPERAQESLHCRWCEAETEQEYTGKSTLEGERGRPVWICTECEEPRFGHEPGDYKPAVVIEDFTDGWQNGRADLHNRVMRAYHDDHGRYPWEG